MLLTLLVLLAGLWFIYDRLIDGRELPPGPGRFPIVGNIIQLALLKRRYPTAGPHVLMMKLGKDYGPVVTAQIGMQRQIVINDHKLIRHILQSDQWQDRPIVPLLLERSWNKPLGFLFTPATDSWRELRRFSIRTLREFGFGKQRGQEALMEEELDELFKRLDKKLEKEVTIPMSQFFTVSVLNIIWSMAAGTRFSHDDSQLVDLVYQINEVTTFLNLAENPRVAFPFLRKLIDWKDPEGVRTWEGVISKLHSQMLGTLKERRELGDYKQEQKDFIDVFLLEIDKRDESKSINIHYTDEQFCTIMFDLFTAGSETTSNSLEFAMLFMLLNPDVQEKVREEIDREVGSGFPAVSMQNKMPYCSAVLLEVHRMASVVPLNGRSPASDQYLLDYKIQKGSWVLLNHYGVHRDPGLWENPEQFNPARFLSEGNEIVNVDMLIPFGGGRRMCMGEVLARATLFTYFVRFLQTYTIEKSPNHPEPVVEAAASFTLSPQPFHAVIKRRKQ